MLDMRNNVADKLAAGLKREALLAHNAWYATALQYWEHVQLVWQVGCPALMCLAGWLTYLQHVWPNGIRQYVRYH